MLGGIIPAYGSSSFRAYWASRNNPFIMPEPPKSPYRSFRPHAYLGSKALTYLGSIFLGGEMLEVFGGLCCRVNMDLYMPAAGYTVAMGLNSGYPKFKG